MLKIKYKYSIILIIFILALFSSLFLSQGFVCNAKEVCDIENSSSLFIPEKVTTGYLGIFIFIFLSIITYLHIREPEKIKKLIIYAGIVIGSIIAIYFLYLQQFILKSYCIYCIIIDIGLLIALLLIAFNWKD